MEHFQYSGNELDNFEAAKNWKRYWSNLIQPYIGSRILEVGAGIGSTTRTLNYLQFDRWLCVEPDINLSKRIDEKIQNGQISRNVEIRNVFSSSLPKEEKFDTILYIDVLEHIERDCDELKTAANLLEDNGKIIILSPAHNFLFSEFDQKIGHYRRYNKKMLKAITPSNLKIINTKYLDSIGLFASLGNKLILKNADPKISQIKLWDDHMISLSKKIDPILGHFFGKSIFTVLKKIK